MYTIFNLYFKSIYILYCSGIYRALCSSNWRFIDLMTDLLTVFTSTSFSTKMKSEEELTRVLGIVPSPLLQI